jgi:hypothetical protein
MQTLIEAGSNNPEFEPEMQFFDIVRTSGVGKRRVGFADLGLPLRLSGYIDGYAGIENRAGSSA